MPTLTIPLKINQDEELIAIPQDVYQEFLEWQKKIKSHRTFIPTRRERKALQRARENFKKGNYITINELR